jgi:protein TonB
MDTNMVLNASFNELVFENRHKNYGAYEIRKRYSKNVLVAGFLAVTLFTMAIGAYFINMPEANASVMIGDPRHHADTTVVVLKKPDENKPKPKPEVKPLPPKGTTNTITTRLVILDSVPPTHMNDSVAGVAKGPFGPGHIKDTGTVACANCGDSVVVKPPRLVTWLVNPPKDPGLDAFFKQNIRYPQLAKEQGIEGVVYLTFIVTITGDVRDVKIAKGANPMLDKEVLRVAKFMPKWEPVKDDHGELVEYFFSKPVRFILSK